MVKYFLLLATLLACVSAQFIPNLQKAFIALYNGEFDKATATMSPIKNAHPNLDKVLPTLDAIMGYDRSLYVGKNGLEGGYRTASTAVRIFFGGNSAEASKLLTKSLSVLKPILSEAQLKYLFTDFLFRNICSVCVCTPQDLAAIANNELLKRAFIVKLDTVPTTPLNTPPPPGSTVIPEPVFKNLLTALVNGDVAGADAMAGQLTSDQVTAIQYAARVMGVHLGTDPSYQHPYGLFAVGDNLARVFNAVVGKDNASAIKALESCFALQACIEGFSDKIPATVDELTGYVSTFFGDPALFRDLYRMHRKNTPPLKLETAAAECKSSR